MRNLRVLFEYKVILYLYQSESCFTLACTSCDSHTGANSITPIVSWWFWLSSDDLPPFRCPSSITRNVFRFLFRDLRTCSPLALPVSLAIPSQDARSMKRTCTVWGRAYSSHWWLCFRTHRMFVSSDYKLKLAIDQTASSRVTAEPGKPGPLCQYT
jgi:hypothetical protein